ncbi:MAG: hypothetical protein Q8O13_09855 [Candidatus Omnitrophota bacterium]|nr:hypothetical protein [Candidatus Omnitrophota bacterium]
MKAFLVGLAFLIAVMILSAIGYPILMLLVGFLRVFVGFAFVILAIWLLGKFIIWFWERIKKI